MKQQISILLFLFAFVFYVSAQEKEARKFEEFDSNTNCEVQWLYLDNLFVQLQKEFSSTAFIIYYEGNHTESKYKKGKLVDKKSVLPRYGEANSKIQILRDYILLRGFDRDRVLYINGGFRKEFVVEFWIVPEGAKLPKPSPTLNNIEYRKGKLPKFRCTDSI